LSFLTKVDACVKESRMGRSKSFLDSEKELKNIMKQLRVRAREKLTIPALGVRVKFDIQRIYYTLYDINNGIIDGRENKGRNRRKREKRDYRT
jgi:hypothetical protein